MEDLNVDSLSNEELDDLYKRLVGMGLIGQRQALLSNQERMAQQLRNTPMPEGQFIPHGGVYVADRWGPVASAVKQFVGMKQARDIQGQQQGLIAQQQDTLQRLMAQIARRMSGDTAPRQTVPPYLQRPEE
jgi:hypothetical protein